MKTRLLTSNFIGLLNESSANSSSRALSAAATWQAFSFIAQGKTLSEVWLYQLSKTGSPVAADITLSLCANTTAGIPDSATVIETRQVSSIPATTGTLIFTGFTTALTEGEQYWVFVRNLNAVPASNFVTVQFGVVNSLSSGRYGVSPLRGWHAVATTNSGAAWNTTITSRVGGPMIRYSDGTDDGAPMSGSVAATGGSQVFGTRAAGVKFAGLVPGLTYNINAASFIVGKSGTPTAALRCRIYNSAGTLLGTSVSLPAVNVGSNSTVQFDFTTAVPCPESGAPYRVVLDQVGAGGTISNCYRVGGFYALSTAPEVLALGPMNGTWCHTTTLDNTAGTISWTDTANLWTPCTLSLDSEAPFTVSGGGGGGVPFIGSRIGGIL